MHDREKGKPLSEWLESLVQQCLSPYANVDISAEEMLCVARQVRELESIKQEQDLKDLKVNCSQRGDCLMLLNASTANPGFAYVSVEESPVVAEMTVSPDDARKVRDWWIKFCEKFDGR